MSKPTENPFESLRDLMVFSAKDWSLTPEEAWLYGIIVGWDDRALADLRERFKGSNKAWAEEDTERLKRLHDVYQRQSLPLQDQVEIFYTVYADYKNLIQRDFNDKYGTAVFGEACIEALSSDGGWQCVKCEWMTISLKVMQEKVNWKIGSAIDLVCPKCGAVGEFTDLSV